MKSHNTFSNTNVSFPARGSTAVFGLPYRWTFHVPLSELIPTFQCLRIYTAKFYRSEIDVIKSVPCHRSGQ